MKNTTFNLHIEAVAGTVTTISTADEDGTITITTVATTDPAVTDETEGALPAEIEAMVQRHEKHGVDGTRSRELARDMIDRNWVAKAGPKYLRFIYTGEKHKVTLYANSRDIMTRDHRDIVDEWPNAIVEKNETRWRYNEANYDTAMAAVDQLEAYADGDAYVDSD